MYEDRISYILYIPISPLAAQFTQACLLRVCGGNVPLCQSCAPSEYRTRGHWADLSSVNSWYNNLVNYE